MIQKKQSITLADFTVPIPLYCHHCDCKFPKSARVEVNGKYVIVQCPKCGLLTPFKVEASA